MGTSAVKTPATASKTTLTASVVHMRATGGDTRLLYRATVKLLKARVRPEAILPGMQRRGSTLVWGTANPEGLKDSYRGVYLNAGDVSSMVEQVSAANSRGVSIPVKLEHSGVSLGRVVSAWESQGTLQCVLEIDEGVLEGSIGAEFVRTGVCKDLSLGYTVEMAQSKTGVAQSIRKKLNEISIVVKGARNKCNVHGVGRLS